MLAKLKTLSLLGIEAMQVEVEVDVSPTSIPKTMLVGLPEAAVKESTHRVERALVNSGFIRPSDRVVINLAPAELPKQAASFDLPISLGILAASNQMQSERFGEYAAVGELALEGHTRPVKGALSMAMSTREEYINGTHSRIAMPCPHCAAWVTPEREHLVGWQEANTQLEARETGRFACPSCQEVWNESQRIEANFKGMLVHDGQVVEEGVVQGSAPATDTLGFRWSAVNNMFLSSGEIAGDEWKASRAVDEENADRERRQFVWCLPVIPTKWSEVEIQEQEITSRVTDLPRGIVPHGCQHLTAAIDLGKHLNHWGLVAWTDGPFAHVVDYGRIEVPSDDLGVEAATM